MKKAAFVFDGVLLCVTAVNVLVLFGRLPIDGWRIALIATVLLSGVLMPLMRKKPIDFSGKWRPVHLAVLCIWGVSTVAPMLMRFFK
ncbi:MAG: hypothetical protein RSF84_05410 [Ruthenibacterium sp.]